jgi:myosin heavy subunit
MLEAIRIRKAGYAIRIDNEDFSRRYKPCLKGTAVQYKDKLANEVCKGILTTVFDRSSKMDSKWQLGFTKVFLKEEARAYLEMRLGDSIKD